MSMQRNVEFILTSIFGISLLEFCGYTCVDYTGFVFRATVFIVH